MRQSLLLLLICGLGACAGDLPQKSSDGLTGDAFSSPWVDTWQSPLGTDQGPTWSSPEAGYSASPFGCQSDADCFGQRCCTTPWGVKLCAPACLQR